jgi:methylglyoxal synthase
VKAPWELRAPGAFFVLEGDDVDQRAKGASLPLRILVAEDESIIRLDVADALEREGFEVCAQARDGVEAVELARATAPDLALLDVKMPRLNGIDAAREIVAARPIPIVLLTAHSRDELVAGAADAGVAGYLTKPFRHSDLVAAIRLAAGRAALGGPAGASRAQIALIAHDGKKRELLELVGEHQTLLRGASLIATETTGRLLEETYRLHVHQHASGPAGGDLQIGALVARGGVDLVVFLRDPLASHPHEPDIQALMKVCDVYRVPLATNVSTAALCLQSLELGAPPDSAQAA